MTDIDTTQQRGPAMRRHRTFVLFLVLTGLAACHDVTFPPPPEDMPPNARYPKDHDDMVYWVQNMTAHQFSWDEMWLAAGIRRQTLQTLLHNARIPHDAMYRRPADAPLAILPYPGGRHPRIGFLDGAIDPQRETKFSAFLPWDLSSYVVVDLPEAIHSNLGLIYLAHTHVETVWTKQNVTLPRLEWTRHEDQSLSLIRYLPNGITYTARVEPGRDAVRMTLTLENGTDAPLTGLRVQNCVMLKMAPDFEQQTNDNKVFQSPFVAVHNTRKNRWVITAWEKCARAWGNAPCPCLHSDPQFPDLQPGEKAELRGWLSFYEGEDVQAAFKRIADAGWLR